MCTSLLLLALSMSPCCLGWWHFGKTGPQHEHQAPKLPEPELELPEGVQATDLRMPGVAPQQNETYLCSSFPLDPEEEHYIVGFEPLADSHQIHHVIVYGCDMPGSDEEAWDCGEMVSAHGRYAHSPVCASQPDIIYAWAHDAPKLILPEEQLEVACVVDEPVELHPFAFRVHTHRHGTNVGGWLVQEDPISGEDHWTLLGQRDPQLPQLFQPLANQSLTITQGDILAARCHIRNDEGRIIKIGPTGEDEMCNFYLMYWTDGDTLEQNACFSPGPPEYKWTTGAGLNHTPKRK